MENMYRHIVQYTFWAKYILIIFLNETNYKQFLMKLYTRYKVIFLLF